MKLQFYKSASAPVNAEVGAIWFDTSTREIKMKTNTSWDTFGSNQEILTQEEYDNLETKDNTKIYFIKEV